MRMRCPKCGGTDHLHVIALVTVCIDADEDGEVSGSGPVNGDHGWDDHSRAYHDYGACGWVGTVGALYEAGEQEK